MSGLGDRYRRRADAFARLIDGTGAAGWSRPSPCEGWVARDVVAHVVDYSGHVLRERAGLVDLPVFASFGNPATAFSSIRAAVEQVLDDRGNPPELRTYVDLAVSLDLPQHGWDLAKATGQDSTMDLQDVEFLWTSLSEHPGTWDWQRTNGWYGAPIEVPDDAPLQDRVLGLLGRDPRWAPPT